MSKEAMKLALEALEVATTPLARDRQEVLRAITALREALAEQPAQQEPVAWSNKVVGGKKWLSIHASKGASDKWLEYRRKEQAWSEQYEQIALYTSPPAQRKPITGWIAVSDRIPLESDGEVLVRMRDGRCEIAWATYWHGASNAFAQWTFRDPDEDEAPTHWMLIPAIEAAHGIKENT